MFYFAVCLALPFF
jgi:hypothetical protein